MTDPRNIATQDFDYHLPEPRIPKYPRQQRDQSNLLIYNQGNIHQDVFRHLARHIPSDHLMVYNNARVVYARLLFHKQTGAGIEVFCLEPHQPADYNQAFQQDEQVEWKCLVGNLKKWKEQDLEQRLEIEGKSLNLKAQKISRQDPYVVVRFSWDHPDITFGDILENMGKVPIPPYLKRESECVDKIRYQTVYSKIRGSVAAPTAGLHFSDVVFEELRNKGIPHCEITLHVGAGTFRPVRAETIDQHAMHMEHFEVSRESLDQLIRHHPNILAVGTTSLRTLESLYWIGLKLSENTTARKEMMLDQWEHLDMRGDLPVPRVLGFIKEYMDKANLETLQASTRIMIAPGYPFKLTRGLITNFHQPKSTLLMLVAAFVGSDWKKIYQYALDHEFRFLSYGDGSLLFPAKNHHGS